MSYVDERRQEILDGKRSWSIHDADDDADVFYTQYVLPLRQLRDRGMFQRLHEHESSRRGTRFVDRIDIGGAVNLDG